LVKFDHLKDPENMIILYGDVNLSRREACVPRTTISRTTGNWDV
jgi:hypothetical protein